MVLLLGLGVLALIGKTIYEHVVTRAEKRREEAAARAGRPT
jgi:hypothetical protein